MNKKNLRQQNITTLIFIVLIILLLNYIASLAFFRFDLTSEKRYSLSETTKNLIKGLDDQVYVKIYLEGTDLPVGFKRLKDATKELLDEYRVYAKTKINYEFVNPSANPDKDIRYSLYNQLYKKGLVPIDLKEKDKEGKASQKIIFPGAIISFKGKDLAVNLLKNNQSVPAEEKLNNSIQSLEYEFTNALTKLTRPAKPVIGFTAGHDELKGLWVGDITKILSEHYDIQRVAVTDTTKNLSRYNVIVIVKPKNPFTEKEKYIIDQFIMNGGKVLWLIEGSTANMDSLKYTNSFIVMPNQLNLEDQLFRYGVRINPVLVEDLQCAGIGLTVPSSSGQPQIKLFPWQYSPIIISNNNHPVIRYLNLIKTDFISTIDTVGASPDITKTILLKSSKASKILPLPSRISLQDIEQMDERQFIHKPQPLAVLLEGIFTSVFQNRNLSQFTNTISDFKPQSQPTKMIIVADGDMIKNEVKEDGETYPIGWDMNSQQTFAGNGEFFLNAINYLCDDSGLMQLRSRELKLRLLDKTKVANERLKWQVINCLCPILIILAFGLYINYLRRQRYTRTGKITISKPETIIN